MTQRPRPPSGWSPPGQTCATESSRSSSRPSARRLCRPHPLKTMNPTGMSTHQCPAIKSTTRRQAAMTRGGRKGRSVGARARGAAGAARASLCPARHACGLAALRRPAPRTRRGRVGHRRCAVAGHRSPLAGRRRRHEGRRAPRPRGCRFRVATGDPIALPARTSGTDHALASTSHDLLIPVAAILPSTSTPTASAGLVARRAASRLGSQHGDLRILLRRAEAVLEEPADVAQASQ